MTELIQVAKSNGVLTLVFSRPEKKNALTDAMYNVLANELEAAETDPSVRAILFRSEGDLFCAGNDVTEFAMAATSGTTLGHVKRFIAALAGATKPLIAAVQGRAVGIGTTLLLHCDYVVLAEDAQLSTPFVGLALVPEAASSLLLPQRIGHARAFAMFVLGDAVNAQDAFSWGIANKVVARAELEAAARHVADRIAKQPLGAVIATKKLMRDAATITAHMNVETEQFASRLTTAEAREAFMAFAERRASDFTKLA
jgi:enoyl-CoA hydratase/carnithine racemase